MPQVDDLTRSFVPFDQSTSLTVVVEMSEASWLVAAMIPGVDRQPLKKLDPDPGALAHQAFALTARALGVHLLGRGHRDHPAMPALATQPAQEHAHEHGRVEPIGLRPAVLARHTSVPSSLTARAGVDVVLDRTRKPTTLESYGNCHGCPSSCSPSVSKLADAIKPKRSPGGNR